MRSDKSLRAAELALMNAPFETDGWSRAIEAVSQASGGSGANLVGIGGPLMLSLNMFTGRKSEQAAAYFSRPELWGACNWRVHCSGRPLSIQHDAHYSEARRSLGPSDYDDAVSDLDMQYGCQSVLLSDSSNFLGLAIFRGRREGPCDEAGLRRFEHLARQVQRSIRMQLALDGEAAELMLGEMEGVHGATLLLDRQGNLCALSRAAEPLFDGGGPLVLSSLAVELRNRAENRHFQQALKRLLSSDGHSGPLVHQSRAGRSADKPTGAWRLFIVRLPARRQGLGFDPHLAVTLKAAD